MKCDINFSAILILSSFRLSLVVRLVEDYPVPHAVDQVVHGLVKPVDRRGDSLLLVSSVGIFGIGFFFLFLDHLGFVPFRIFIRVEFKFVRLPRHIFHSVYS